MEEDFKTTPMKPLREILNELEERFETMDVGPNQPPCPKCNGTGTEVIRNLETKITSARPCSH